MKTLVTGGAGFIGSTLVDKLLHAGHEVTVIDNESSDAHDRFYWNSEAHNYKYDINDYTMVRGLYEGIDTVFHLAAEARIQPCIEDPIKAVEANMLGTASVLQCARMCGVKRVIYSSTSAAYGLNNTPSLVETMSNDCLNPYSVTKVGGEELCKMYSKLYGLETIIFRYFNVYGERQPIRGQYAPVIGIFLRQRKAKENLTIVGDGEQRRDFIHVSDVADVNILAAEFIAPKYNIQNNDGDNTHIGWKWGQIYNIGTSKNYSINKIASIIGGERIHLPPREGEARNTLANSNKANTAFNWIPKINLEDWISKQS